MQIFCCGMLKLGLRNLLGSQEGNDKLGKSKYRRLKESINREKNFDKSELIVSLGCALALFGKEDVKEIPARTGR